MVERDSMTVGRQIVRILGLAAFLAALALAPSAAQAHAGHGYSGHAAIQTDAAPTEHAGKAAAAQELRSAPAPAGTADDTSCADRGCCTNGHSIGCCGFVVPSLTMTFPSALSSSLLFRDAPPRASLAPEALRKPPKFFA